MIAYRHDRLERVQVKYTQSDGRVVYVRCRSHSLTNGKVRQIKRYTARTIDWIGVYDSAVDRCFYVPASELGNGRDLLTLRLAPTRNSQELGIRHADDYVAFAGEPASCQRRLVNPADPRESAMEPAGFEPATSAVQGRRSTN